MGVTMGNLFGVICAMDYKREGEWLGGGRPCPYEDCGSSDAFSLHSGGYGKCHSCERKYPSNRDKLFDWAEIEYPSYKSTDSHREAPMQPKLVSSVSPTENNLTPVYKALRGVTAETMKKYKCLSFLDPQGVPVKQDYVYPSGGKKTRFLKAKSFSASGLRSDELYGQDLYNGGTSKSVTITEGELDAMSAYQMLNTNSRFTNPVVSLPSATPSQKLWSNVHEWLDSFEKIILSVDNDEAGNAVATKIAKLFPTKTYRVPHDKFKDANEFLQAGQAKDYVSAWWNAKKYQPDNIYSSPDQFLKLYEKSDNHVYIKTGVTDFDEMCLGLMQGHFTLFKAQTGIGKTEFMRYLEYQILTENPDVKLATWHMEETKLRSILGLVSYETGDNLTRTDLIESKGADRRVREAILKLTKEERLYQFYLNDEDDPLDILSQIRYLSQACGVNYVFFEPIQDIAANAGGDESKEQFLADLAVRLSKLAAELGVGIVTIGHTNDDGQVKYCRMIEQRASVVVDLQRDKMAEDMDERNTTKLLVTKNRPVGPTGYAGQMKFDPETFTMKEERYFD